MPDFLLSEVTIHLFGQVVDELTIGKDLAGDGRTAKGLKGWRTIARVYAFAFQNEYVELASPALFVVKNAGDPVKGNLDLGLARLPETLNPGLTVWKVDMEDLTVRLDVMAGTFDRVLLDYELADTGLQGFVRGGEALGTPTAVRKGRRQRRWRSDDE